MRATCLLIADEAVLELPQDCPPIRAEARLQALLAQLAHNLLLALTVDARRRPERILA